MDLKIEECSDKGLLLLYEFIFRIHTTNWDKESLIALGAIYEELKRRGYEIQKTV